jgi:hypothetical protein
MIRSQALTVGEIAILAESGSRFFPWASLPPGTVLTAELPHDLEREREPMTPRNDWVLVKVTKVKVGSLTMPDQSSEGSRNTIVAIGPDVVDLKVGEVVEVRQATNDGIPTILEIPDPEASVTKKERLVMVRQEQVILVYDRAAK